MRILHVLATCDPVRGAGMAERTRFLTKALTDQGASCTVLTQDIGLDDKRRSQLAHVRLRALPCVNERYYVPALWPGAIRSAVAEADIVELTSHWTLLNALAYRSARRLGVPYLVHPAGALGIVGRSATFKRIFNHIVGYRMVHDADGHIAVTPGEAAEYATYGISRDRLSFIPNGVELPSHQGDSNRFRSRHGLNDRRIVLFVGRLSEIKGPDLLLDAFARVARRHADWTLVFVGPDQGMQSALADTARTHGLANRVLFTGFLDGADKEDAYAAADFLALPSRREAMSLVALEAGMRGRPVLATDQCGFPEIETCGGGLIVGANVGSLQSGLERMMDPMTNLAGIGQRLKDHVSASYTWDRAARSYLSLCELAQTQARNKRDHDEPVAEFAQRGQ